MNRGFLSAFFGKTSGGQNHNNPVKEPMLESITTTFGLLLVVKHKSGIYFYNNEMFFRRMIFSVIVIRSNGKYVMELN